MEDQRRKTFIEEKFRDLYGEKPDIWVRAPGRVDLMGSHTDYNLGYVLIQAINRSTWIAARPRSDGKIRIASLNLAGRAEFELTRIEHDAQIPWSNYVRGVAQVLLEENYPLTGFDGLVESTIPFGSGLSSSAALEVATMEVFETLSNWRIDPLRKALFCQQAENQFVGMQCGIMDQYASVMGREGCILLLDCRSITSEIEPVAPGLRVVICDTRAERALTGSEYSQRRAQCEAGAALLANFYPGIQSLRDVSLDQLQAHQADMDPVIYKRCYFILQENQRVLDMAAALTAGRHAEAGRLAVESFNGARDLYEIVSREMQAMFNAIMEAPGVFGTRGAGAGFGGCLVAFVRDDRVDAFMDHVQRQYARGTGIQAEIYPVRALDGAGILNLEQDSPHD